MKLNKKDVRVLGLFLIVVALFFGLSYFNITASRAQPVFDGDATQDFRLTLIDAPSTVTEGDVMRVSVEVLNLGETGGMYLECGLYDRGSPIGSWVPRAAVEILPEVQNCQMNEPFVQTARVTLPKNRKVVAHLQLNVPEISGRDTALFCGTYERCWAPGVNTYQTDFFVKDVTVLKKEIVEEENGEVDENGVDNDEIIEVSETVGFNEKLKDWMQENSMLFFLIVLILLIIGAYFVYKEPKIEL